VASTLESLGGLAAGQQRYGQARRQIERALSIREKQLGPWNRTVAEDLNNIASLYCREQRYKDAEPSARRALAILEKAGGPECPANNQQLTTNNGFLTASTKP